MKPVYSYSILVAVFGLLVYTFGYFDADLPDERRYAGCAVIIIGISIALPALERLAADWSRLKPEHSVDLAFLQIMLSAAVLSIACLMGGRSLSAFRSFTAPTPQLLAAPDRASTAPTR